MTSSFFIYSFIGTLIPWMISVDSLKPNNVTHNARAICLLGKAKSDFNEKNTAIELTAGLSLGDFFSKGNIFTAFPIYFKLRIFSFLGKGYKEIEMLEETKTLRNTFKLDLSNFRQPQLVLENKSISELLGLGIQTGSSFEPSGLIDEQQLNFLDIIKFRISLSFDFDAKGKLSMINGFSIDPVSREVPNFQTYWVTEELDRKFPFKIEVLGHLKYFWSETLIKKLSQINRLENKILHEAIPIRENATRSLNSFLMSDYLQDICFILDALTERLPKVNETARLVNLQSNLFETFEQNPDQARKYYHSGLTEVFDPFSAFQDHYIEYYTQQSGENIKCSKILENYLEEQVESGKTFLNNLYADWEIKTTWVNGELSKYLCVPFYYFIWQEPLEEPYFKVNITLLTKVDVSFVQNLEEIDRIKETFQKGVVTHDEVNYLEKFDSILKKIFDRCAEKAGDLTSIFIFRSDKGHVIQNYLRLIRFITGEEINVSMEMSIPDIPKAMRDSGKSALHKPSISRFIFTLAEFLELKKFKNKKKDIEYEQRRINSDHLSNNLEVFFNLVKQQCTEEYLRTLPLGEVAFNLQVYSQEVRENWFELIMDQKSGPKINQKIMKDLYEKTQSNYNSFAEIIRESVKENFEEVIKNQEAQKGQIFVKYFTRVLIHQCFGDAYENDLKLAEYTERLGYGASHYLRQIQQKLAMLMRTKKAKKEQDQIEDLILIGDFIYKLKEHSELNRFMEIFYGLLDNVSRFGEEILDAENRGDFIYHVEKVKNAAESVLVEKKKTGFFFGDRYKRNFIQDKNQNPGEMSTNKIDSGDNGERKAETTTLLGENEYEFKELYN